MSSFNNVTLVGRLTKDPEVRGNSQAGSAIVKISVAVDRRYAGQSAERKTDFFDCTLFKNNAEFVQKYGKKGRMVIVNGRVEINKVPGKDDGIVRTYVDVVCDDVKFLDKATEVADDVSDTDDEPL